jgi:hypothetical protein
VGVAGWSFVIGWPIAVVILNNLLTGQQLKHMADVTCENLNKTGRVMQMLLNSIRGIEEALGQHGIEITSPTDSKDAQDVWRIAR